MVSLTNVSDWVDGIKGSVDGCSGCAIDKERQMPFAFVPNDKFLQLFGDHSTSVILDLTFSYFFRNFKGPPVIGGIYFLIYHTVCH